MNPATLNWLLDDLLRACVDAYELPGAPAAPARQVKQHGQLPPWDGEQLTVACTGLRPVSPFPITDRGPHHCAVIPAADLTVELVRACWPVVEGTRASGPLVPDASQISDATRTLTADAGALWASVTPLAINGRLFPSVAGIACKDVLVGPLVPLAPQGQLAGWRWTFTVKLAVP